MEDQETEGRVAHWRLPAGKEKGSVFCSTRRAAVGCSAPQQATDNAMHARGEVHEVTTQNKDKTHVNKPKLVH